MANEKKSLPLEYRLKPRYKTKKQQSVWQPISESDAKKVKGMEPHRYEFREKEPLAPTKSMKVDDNKE